MSSSFPHFLSSFVGVVRLRFPCLPICPYTFASCERDISDVSSDFGEIFFGIYITSDLSVTPRCLLEILLWIIAVYADLLTFPSVKIATQLCTCGGQTGPECG